MIITPAIAHDFWLQPERFAMPQPGTVPMRIFVGHGPARDRWGVSADRVLLFRAIGPYGIVDMKPALTLDGPQYDATLSLLSAGSHLLVFQSSPALSDLPYLRFNDYVAMEGLTPISEARAKAGTERSNGREMYSRRAKAIVQIGPVTAADVARVTRPVGLSLEIVPETHPLLLKPGQKLSVRILYEKAPLAKALVKLTNLDADDKPLATARTDAAGRASFAIPPRGSWQFNVVWAQSTPGNPAADYRTTFSSLTFGH